MAHGVHWEWRAFGVVSSDFSAKFEALDHRFRPQIVSDLYLWIPSLEVNAKFRKGAEGGLKFKRLHQRVGSLERWSEDPSELFDFPLERKGWNTLCDVLATAGLALGDLPEEPLTRPKVLDCLRDAGCTDVLVEKQREGRLWTGPHGKVKVEWACISKPQRILSIGLETWDEEGTSQTVPDEQAKATIEAAIEALDLAGQPLSVLNYMGAVELWAQDRRV